MQLGVTSPHNSVTSNTVSRSSKCKMGRFVQKKKNLPTEKGKMHKGHQGEVGSKYQGQQTATKLHSGTPKTLLPK